MNVSILEVFGIAAVVVLVQILLIILSVWVAGRALRRAGKQFIEGVTRGYARATREDGNSAEDDPLIEAMLRSAARRRHPVGNPRSRFVEPGKLDL